MRYRELVRQAVVLAAALARRSVRRILGEASVLGAARGRVLVAAGGASALLLLVLIGLTGTLAGALVSGSSLAQQVFVGVLSLVAALLPFLVGRFSLLLVAGTLADPTHALVRPALISPVVLVLARIVLPAMAKLCAAVVALGAFALAALSVVGVPLLATAAWLGWWLLAGTVVLGARVVLVSLRLRAVSALRGGRTGASLVAVLLLAQIGLAFLLPHAVVRVLDGTAGPEALLAALGRALTPGDARIAGVGWVVAGAVLAAVVLGALAVPCLQSALAGLRREFRQASAAAADLAVRAAPLPQDTLRALLVKDWRIARRSGGPVLGPMIGTAMTGCVLAAFLLGLMSAGWLPGRESAAATGFQVLVAALIAAEFAGMAIRVVTSPDADGPAAALLRAPPGAGVAVTAAKARFHAVAVAVVTGMTIGTLALIVPATSGGKLAVALLVLGAVVVSTLVHVGAPAVHPRLDWTSLEQIGGNPRAHVLGLTLTVIGFAALNPLVVLISATDHRVPTALVTGLLLVVVALAPRTSVWATNTLVRRLGDKHRTA